MIARSAVLPKLSRRADLNGSGFRLRFPQYCSHCKGSVPGMAPRTDCRNDTQMKQWRALTIAALTCCSLAWQQAGAQPTPAPARIPDFSSNKMTWVLMNGTAYFRVPGDTGPGPIMQQGKEYKHDDVPRIADTSNPILKPWAKKLMDINNQRVLAGGLPFYTTSRCWPGGVPGLLLFPGEPVVFAQTPKEVWILYQRDAQVRRVYMNVPHSEHPR